jgi:hypothetical protein
MQWIHAILGISISDALNVFRCAEPQIGCPDLHTELAVQKD